MTNALRFAIALTALLGPAAQAAELPKTLQAKLRGETAACGYRIFASGASGRLDTDPKFMSNVKANLDSRVNSWLSGGGATAASAGSAVYAVAVHSQAWNNIGPVGTGVALSTGSSSAYSFKKAAGVKSDSANFDEKTLSQHAGEAAQSAARVIGLDAVREDALRTQLVKEIKKKIDEKDNAPIEVSKVLKDASYRGKPLLTEREAKAVDELFNHAVDPTRSPNFAGFSDEEAVKFLSACKEIVRQQLSKISGTEKAAAVRTLEGVASVQSDLNAYVAAHPEAPDFAMPEFRQRIKSASTDTETTMEVR